MTATWKAIGQSIIGTSHIASGKPCEDAVRYAILDDVDGSQVLVCCAADGAGSALHAQWASSFATQKVVDFAAQNLLCSGPLAEADIYSLAEEIYDGLQQEAVANDIELNEYSCTLLGCIATSRQTAFFQVGDGAIVRNDGSGFYTTLWWPENGEYQNTTSFLIDDSTLSKLNVAVVDEPVDEVAIFTDGLQLLTLNIESRSVHQPFFNDLFRYLRQATDADKIKVLNRKLAEYLGSPNINDRTDDDKTLFLATRLSP